MSNTHRSTPITSEKESVEIVDLLISEPSTLPFSTRVTHLQLSGELEQKVHLASSGYPTASTLQLTSAEEKELATEVLLLRHKFTELVWKTPRFNQAALSVIQNIYLFKQRKIFFDPCGPQYEAERREALHLFTAQEKLCALPLGKTFQHLIIARVWSRIRNQSSPEDYKRQVMEELLKIVEGLNTIRNIYVLLTTSLVKKLVSQMSELYKEGITQEDANQIGSFGIARAAYRYHPSAGVRFSTFAGNWVKKELQRQTLSGRLIRISTNTVEMYIKALKEDDSENRKRYSNILKSSCCKQEDPGILENTKEIGANAIISEQENILEVTENKETLQLALSSLSDKERNIIQRRFGLPPHSDKPQSIISISEFYGVTRSSIYQLENKTLEKLRKALVKKEPFYC